MARRKRERNGKMIFDYEKLTKKEKQQYDSLPTEGKEIYEKSWCKIQEQKHKMESQLARFKDAERKKRTRRLIQIGGAVESALGKPIEGEENLKKLTYWLKKNHVEEFVNVQLPNDNV